MTRVLQAPTLTADAHRLAAPGRVLDDATRELLEHTRERAHAEGRAQGVQEAAEAADRAAERVTSAIAVALATCREELTAVHEQYARGILDLARRVAIAVIGEEPHDGGQALLDRLHAALGALDHGPFTLFVAAADEALVDRSRLDLPDGSCVEVDPALRPGEARIQGPWSEADLTRDTVVAIVAAAMAQEAPQPDPSPLDVHRAPEDRG